MAILNRNDFKQYCLRKLGEPVIRVNCAPEQVEDRINDALERFHEEHYDGTEETWLAYKITQADIDNNYLTISDDILTVVETMNLGETSPLGNDMFSHQYQFAIQNLSPFQTLDMINYFMAMTNMNEVYDMINASPRVEHTRFMNKVQLYNGISNLSVDTVIALRVFRIIDPEMHTRIYNDIWLKKYATALIKMQWGNNMKKHGDVQLLGGVTVNGQQFYDESLTELELLEKELEQKFAEPVDFFLG